jgi:hypothetical protein
MSLNFKSEELTNILNEIISNQNIKRDNICSICKDPLILDTVLLGCKHRYHSSCLQESFIKYESKKCPLCREIFLWDSYKTKCVITKTNNEICGKKCFNDEKMCNLHIKTYLKRLEKEKNKQNIVDIKEGKKKKKKIKIKITQINKLKDKIKLLENEIKLLGVQIN